MISGRHEHRCVVCELRFECLQMTHCRKWSDDPDYSKRPVCYKDECRIAREAVVKYAEEKGETGDAKPSSKVSG